MRYKTLIILVVTAVMILPMFPSGAFAKRHQFTKGEIEHAKAVHAHHAKDLLQIPGVQAVGIGDNNGKPGILVLVDEESRRPHIPKTLEDLSAVTLVVGEISAHGIDLGTSGGNSLICRNYCSGGTVGFKVCDNTNAGVSGIITNNHVAASGCPDLCPNTAPLGTVFFAPGVIDTNPVCSTTGADALGPLNRFIPIVLDGRTINYADAAFVQSTDILVSNNIQDLGAQNNTIAEAYLGQPVCKSGRTSGMTCGTVTGISLTINVNYGGRCGTGKFSHVIMYEPSAGYEVMSQSGDSGSPVVETGTNKAVALNFAGTSSGIGFGNSIGDVLSALNVSLCDSVSGTPSDVSTTVTTSPPGKQISVDGTTYTAPHTFSSAVGASQTLGVPSPQSDGTGTQYVFSSWSDGGSQTHTITTSSASATYTAFFSMATASLPNLTPYQPAGWSDKIVVSDTRRKTTDSNPLYKSDRLYVSWAVINDGTAATNRTFYTKIYIDGVQKTSWYSGSQLSPNYYTYVIGYSIGRLSAGTHTVKIITDETGVIPESNESDNVYTKTITVQ